MKYFRMSLNTLLQKFSKVRRNLKSALYLNENGLKYYLLVIFCMLLTTCHDLENTSMDVQTPELTKIQENSGFVLRVSPSDGDILTQESYTGSSSDPFTIVYHFDDPNAKHNSLICAEIKVEPPIWYFEDDITVVEQIYDKIESQVQLVVDGIHQKDFHGSLVSLPVILKTNSDGIGQGLEVDNMATWAMVKEQAELPPVGFCWKVPLTYGVHQAEFSYVNPAGETYYYQWSFEIIE
ncbi:MAG: hypothetical protein OT477_02520 [Chloroflexi bacterium]|nr:hypothetical protein [Chloroflexota bacterium]